MRRLSLIFCLLLFAALPTLGEERWTSVGVYSSVKGAGVSLLSPSKGASKGDCRECFILRADFAGILSTGDMPGGKFTWKIHYPLRSGETSDGVRYTIYVGPGLSTGYVKDYYKERDRGFGLMMSMCSSEGIIFEFKRHPVSIAMEFTQEIGFHMNNLESLKAMNMGLYNRGIFDSYLPELKIYWNFGGGGK